MLYIKKSQPSKEVINDVNRVKREHKSILDKQTPQNIREVFNSLDKSLIRECLIKEQHGLCAYCMQRIDNDINTSIEHWKPIDIDKDIEGALDYNNMIGICNGGRTIAKDDWPNGLHILCCDAAKGNQEITISPYIKSQMDKIRYSEDGKIYTYPEDKILENDINNILHLNGENGLDTSTRLLHGRKEAYKSFYREMKRQGKNLKRSYIEKRIKAIESQEIYPAFAGVILYLLKKKLRRLE